MMSKTCEQLGSLWQKSLLSLANCLFICGLTGSVAYPNNAAAQSPLQPRKANSDGYFQSGAKVSPNTQTTDSAQSLPAQLNVQVSQTNQPVSTAETFEPSQVVALVGGEPLFLADMLLEVNQILDKMLANAPANVRERERRNLIYILTARKYVDQKLMAVHARKNLPENVTWDSLLGQAGQEFEEKALPKLLEKSNLDNVTTYDAMLRSKGSSLRQVKQSWAEDQLVRYFNFQKMDMDPEISHQEMLDYYQSHSPEFFHEAQVKWEEIMVRFDRFSDRDAAYLEIVKLGNEVAFGATFKAVAERSSQGFTAHKGGQYDWTLKGSLVNKTLEAKLFELPIGYLSDLIESDLGVHIVRVIERQDSSLTPFRDAQVEIKEKLLTEKREALVAEHISKLRQEIPVEILWQPASAELLTEKK